MSQYIMKNLTDINHSTPLVKLDRIMEKYGLDIPIYGKCEFFQSLNYGSFWSRWARKLMAHYVECHSIHIQWPIDVSLCESNWHQYWPIVHSLIWNARANKLAVELIFIGQFGSQLVEYNNGKMEYGNKTIKFILNILQSMDVKISSQTKNEWANSFGDQQINQNCFEKGILKINLENCDDDAIFKKAFIDAIDEMLVEICTQIGEENAKMLTLIIDYMEYNPPFLYTTNCHKIWSEFCKRNEIKILVVNEEKNRDNESILQIQNHIYAESIHHIHISHEEIQQTRFAIGHFEGILAGNGSVRALAGAIKFNKLNGTKMPTINGKIIVLLSDGIIHAPEIFESGISNSNGWEYADTFSYDQNYQYQLNGNGNGNISVAEKIKINAEKIGNQNEKQMEYVRKSVNKILRIDRNSSILPDISFTIGQTPLLRINNLLSEFMLPNNQNVEIFAKCEFINPGGSAKDRIAFAMFKKCKAADEFNGIGQLDLNENIEQTNKFTIVEPTAGNTGIGLAMMAAIDGHKCICVMPEKMSMEKEYLLNALGTKIIRAKNVANSMDPNSYISIAKKLVKECPNCVHLDQCQNEANPAAHYFGTAEEILSALEGMPIDILVIGAATGGTLTGIARKIKEKMPECKIIGVDSNGHSVLSCSEMKTIEKENKQNKLEGLGYDFIPAVLEQSLVDEWIRVEDSDAFKMAKLLNSKGLPCGGSSGAVVWAALQCLKTEKISGKFDEEKLRIVTVLPDGMRNYLSTFLDDNWIIENGFSHLLAKRNNQKPNAKLSLLKPERKLYPLNIQSIKLFGSGPTNMRNEIQQQAFHQPILSPLSLQFSQVLEDVKMGLRYLFQTTNEFTFVVSGTGHAGLECALFNLLEKGDRLLVIANGRWGECVKQIGQRREEIEVHSLPIEWGKVTELEEFEKAIVAFKPNLVYLCHGESSTGVLQPLDGFAQICHSNGALLLVDAVASLGVVPLLTDHFGLDCVFAASQKVLNCPPGLAPITFSPRAIEKILQRKSKVASYYFDVLELGSMWGCHQENENGLSNSNRKFHHTLPISMIYALREGIFLLMDKGLEKSWEEHKNASEYLCNKLQKMGFELFVKNESQQLPSMTTIQAPKEIQWEHFNRAMFVRGYEISRGLGALSDRVWRISLFGQMADTKEIDGLLAAINESMKESKFLMTN